MVWELGKSFPNTRGLERFTSSDGDSGWLDVEAHRDEDNLEGSFEITGARLVV